MDFSIAVFRVSEIQALHATEIQPVLTDRRGRLENIMRAAFLSVFYEVEDFCLVGFITGVDDTIILMGVRSLQLVGDDVRQGCHLSAVSLAYFRIGLHVSFF